MRGGGAVQAGRGSAVRGLNEVRRRRARSRADSARTARLEAALIYPVGALVGSSPLGCRGALGRLPPAVD